MKKLQEPIQCKRYLAQIGPNIAPTWHQKTGKMGYPIGPGRPKMGYPIGPGRPKIREKHQRNKEEGSISQGPPPGAEKVANMAPTWVPKWSQDG